jgi:catechol 2,3-dioxygenase-like lactoylglutathione lyase family enzyme
MRCVLTVVLVMSSLFAQTNVQRPHVLGLAHVAFRVSDLSKTRAFYENFLGYAEPFSLIDGNGKTSIAFVKVNEEQYVELFQGDAESRGQLDHFALYTDDLAAMREYLLGQRVPLLADIHQGRVGNSFLTVRDPDGHQIEILQYLPSSLTAQSLGKFMPPRRVSSHITHVGIVVSSVGSAMKFYRDVLGFREFAHGGGGGGQHGWVDLQAPDGSDYVVLIPFAGVPSPVDLRAQNHFCLASSDVRKTVASLQARATSDLLTSPITLQTGDNMPTRANLFDPDGARVELMERMSARASQTATSYP